MSIPIEHLVLFGLNMGRRDVKEANCFVKLKLVNKSLFFIQVFLFLLKPYNHDTLALQSLAKSTLECKLNKTIIYF